MFFAGFIITYQRSEIIADTLQKLFDQTFPPEKLWVIDNSEDFFTGQIIKELDNSKVIYFRVGNNVGPAGAASIGLKLVADAGYQWIYWGDDNDPPPYPDTFARLFLLVQSNEDLKIGQVGVVGQRFDPYLGKTVRLRDKELEESSFVTVDTISGNQSKIINSAVIREGIMPSPELFFGFEELDFDLKMGRGTYLSLVDSTMFMELRKKYQRVQFERPVYTKKSSTSISREYYSIRNMLIILKRNGLHFGYLYFLLKSLAKGLYGFRYGWRFGILNFKFVYTGIWHSIIGKKGRLEIFQNIN